MHVPIETAGWNLWDDPDVFADVRRRSRSRAADTNANTYRPTNPEAVCLLQNQDNSPAGGSRTNTYGSGDPSSPGEPWL